jgi:hypothetical protein
MNRFIYLGLFIGSTIGGFVTYLVGADYFSGALISTAFGAIGVLLGFRLGKEFE